MIFSTLTDFTKYTNLHPMFKVALGYYLDNANHLSDGRYEIDGENLFLTISTDNLRKKESAKLEAHDEYIDIQIVMEGVESYGVASREKLIEPEERNGDLIFFKDAYTNTIELSSGDLAVFFPSDAHAPLIGEGKVRKAIFKVKVAL